VVETWSEAETEKFYRTVLTDAGAIASRIVSKGHEDSRRKTWAEFEAFVQKVGRGLTTEPTIKDIRKAAVDCLVMTGCSFCR
jgi:hypothetical protein